MSIKNFETAGGGVVLCKYGDTVTLQVVAVVLYRHGEASGGAAQADQSESPPHG